MAKLRPDIQTIADENPELARLLEFRATFLWSDWKLFRAKNARGLAEQIRVRADVSVWGSLALAFYFVLFWGVEAIQLIVEGSRIMGFTYVAIAVISLVVFVAAYRRRVKVSDRLNELGYPNSHQGFFARTRSAFWQNQNTTFAETQDDFLKLATEDPEMAKLLEMKRYFKYRDHQLFREKSKSLLAANLLKRIRLTQAIIIGFSVIWLSFAVVALWMSLSNGHGRSTQFLYYVAMAIIFVAGVNRQRKQKAFLRSLLAVDNANQP